MFWYTVYIISLGMLLTSNKAVVWGKFRALIFIFFGFWSSQTGQTGCHPIWKKKPIYKSVIERSEDVKIWFHTRIPQKRSVILGSRSHFFLHYHNRFRSLTRVTIIFSAQAWMNNSLNERSGSAGMISSLREPRKLRRSLPLLCDCWP